MKEAEEQAETTLEAEVQKIVDEDDVKENDMLRNKPHNGHIDDPAGVKESEEDFETVEEVKFNEAGEVELDDDDVIDESLMQRWCAQSIESV